ncbi:hypothetical protein H4R34_001600 [Dimargaris verticillata]|uniref:TNFR-Cys domain-containing protein n=1 Tax=Dimargaris verticillata TaxID=2761393 RepID=A0A9W8B9N3_9FUNG|nr:hypothetical protein H4R34_001600 [Dimargaris verticillata]
MPGAKWLLVLAVVVGHTQGRPFPRPASGQDSVNPLYGSSDYAAIQESLHNSGSDSDDDCWKDILPPSVQSGQRPRATLSKHWDSFWDVIHDGSTLKPDDSDGQSFSSSLESALDSETSKPRSGTSAHDSSASQHSELCGQDGRFCDKCTEAVCRQLEHDNQRCETPQEETHAEDCGKDNRYCDGCAGKVCQQLSNDAQHITPSLLEHPKDCGHDNKLCDVCFKDVCKQLERSQYEPEAQLTPNDEQKITTIVEQLEDLQLQFPGQYTTICQMLTKDIEDHELRLTRLLNQNESSSSISIKCNEVRRHLAYLREVLRRLQNLDSLSAVENSH